VQLRLALGALTALLVGPVLPAAPVPNDLFGTVGIMAMEVGVGLLFGFASRMIFFIVETAGGVIGTEMGLNLPPSLNPISETQSIAPSLALYYLAAMLWLSLDMHHWMLVGFEKTYSYLPVGGAHVSRALLTDLIGRTSGIF